MISRTARKRLSEALAKVRLVYMATSLKQAKYGARLDAVTTADMVAIEKIINKCLKRLE